jgi:hypothetical protein
VGGNMNKKYIFVIGSVNKKIVIYLHPRELKKVAVEDIA